MVKAGEGFEGEMRTMGRRVKSEYPMYTRNS